jgi:type I restriction enzyme S subunit
MIEIRYRTADDMKDSRVEWIGEIPKEWEISKIKFITTLNKKTLPENQKKDLIIHYIDIGSVDGYGTINNIQDFIFKEAPSRARRIVYVNDVIVSTVRTYLRAIAFIDDRYNNHICSTGFAVFTSNSELLDSKFFYYLISSNDYVSQVVSRSTGVSYPAINASDIGSLHCSYPTKLYQQKISNFLDIKTAQFDYIVAKKEQLIQKLEEAKKSLISEVVTGKMKIVDSEMVRRKPEEMKDSGVEWLGMIPKDWEVKRIKFVLYETTNRSSFGKEEPLSMSQKYGLIKSSEMDHIPNQAINLKGNKICEDGDLVFNKLKSHLGVFSVSNQKGIVSPDYAVYRSLGNINTKFLEYLFKTPTYITQFNKYSKGVGAGLTRLYTDDLFNLVTLYPALDKQNEIVDSLNDQIQNMNSIIRKFEFQIQKLKQAKQSLISEAVTGKIDLRNWNII